MSVKTFEREVKKLSSEFTNLIENYDFEEYDFHSIRQTLQDYIEQTYPNYNDFFRSDYVMMLIELFAFYGEMMAYRVDMNMNEAYLSTAKDRKNIIKIADMLGYKYSRIIPSYSIIKINISDEKGGSRFISKKKEQGSINDILSKSNNIVFAPMKSDSATYFPYKLDYLLKTITAEEFMNTLENIFKKLEDFNQMDGVKVKRVLEDNFEYYERSIFVDKFQMGFDANTNMYVTYAGSSKMFELQTLKFDPVLYFNTENTEDALQYDEDNLYSGVTEVGFEFVLKYDKGNNILDKNVYMYLPSVQGGTYTRQIDSSKSVKNYTEIAYEKNIFNNKTIIKQYDENDKLIRTYYQVENLSNNTHLYAYEINNTPDGFIELVFGDGKNSEILLPATKTLLFYRKNPGNTPEIYNVKNSKLDSIALNISYYDNNINQTQTTTIPVYIIDKFNASGGSEAETDEQIKYMARKLRSVQDRFVTGSDYETAGMLHPRVRYSTVILRSYIGKNSARMSNEFLDVYFDQYKNNIQTYKSIDLHTQEITDTFVIVPTAYFTPSTVTDKYDSIKFLETNAEYYFDIFDGDSISPNEWFKYPEEILSNKSKGTVLKLLNRLIEDDLQQILTDANKVNSLLPMEYTIESIEYIGSSQKHLNFKLNTTKQLNSEEIKSAIVDNKAMILANYNKITNEYEFEDITIIENQTGYTLSLLYSTNNIYLPSKDLSFVWSHYKSDDIFINPSKSNIVEIYVTGIKKDLKKGIELYEPLTGSEINKLISEIDKRKMMSDIVQVYNSSIFSIEVAIKVYKNKNSSITNELLRSKIDKELDHYFDIKNIPLGTHFYMSKLIEWLHKNISEIQHIEMIFDENGNYITPSSTLDLLGERNIFTQIVEKTQIINDKIVPQRQIEIVS